MTIKDFATKYKTRIKQDELGDFIIPAKYGQIYDFGGGKFGVMFLTDSVGRWNNRRKACEAAGMKCVQDGDTEGTLLFDPQDISQAKTAISQVEARQKRQMTPEQRKAAAERLSRFQFSRT